MSKLLALLKEGEPLDISQMAKVLGMSNADVEAELEALQADGSLLGWRPVLHPNVSAEDMVRALIEVRITPERDGGFDRISERIARFEEVESCYLMSGGYDLMVVVRGRNLHSVAAFVSQRLSSIEGVLSTATHFMLRAYKEQGYQLHRDQRDADKPSVSP